MSQSLDRVEGLTWQELQPIRRLARAGVHNAPRLKFLGADASVYQQSGYLFLEVPIVGGLAPFAAPFLTYLKVL